MSSHEPIRSHKTVSGGSNRAFGLVFALFFFLVGAWPLIRHGESPRLWAFPIAAVFLLLALFSAETLAPLNKLWLKLGLAMQAVISPIIMALLFYLAVTPTGFVMRLLGHDLLRLKRNNSDSYWIDRSPTGPKKGTFKNQY